MSRHRPTPPASPLDAGVTLSTAMAVAVEEAPPIDYAAEIAHLSAENAALLAENARLHRALDSISERATLAATVTALCNLALVAAPTSGADRARRNRWLDRAMAAGDALSAD